MDNVPIMTNGMSAVHFGASKDFHTHTQQQELDSAFLGAERRPWVKAKQKPNSRFEVEAIMALLATSSKAEDLNTEHVHKLVEENISFRDLASLTGEDLRMFGFTAEKVRNELLKMFSIMPNQNPSYTDICNGPEAKGYNGQIVGNAANHILYLRSALAATNYKLQITPPEDVIVGDKRYASRFALEALNSVQLISDELSKDLHKLQQNKKASKESATPAKERNLQILYYTALALGTACAWFWWWSKRSQSPSLGNTSVKI